MLRLLILFLLLLAPRQTWGWRLTARRDFHSQLRGKALALCATDVGKGGGGSDAKVTRAALVALIEESWNHVTRLTTESVLAQCEEELRGATSLLVLATVRRAAELSDVSRATVQSMFNEADVNKDGQLTYLEWFDWLGSSTLNAHHEKSKDNDSLPPIAASFATTGGIPDPMVAALQQALSQAVCTLKISARVPNNRDNPNALTAAFIAGGMISGVLDPGVCKALLGRMSPQTRELVSLALALESASSAAPYSDGSLLFIEDQKQLLISPGIVSSSADPSGLRPLLGSGVGGGDITSSSNLGSFGSGNRHRVPSSSIAHPRYLPKRLGRFTTSTSTNTNTNTNTNTKSKVAQPSTRVLAPDVIQLVDLSDLVATVAPSIDSPVPVSPRSYPNTGTGSGSDSGSSSGTTGSDGDSFTDEGEGAFTQESVFSLGNNAGSDSPASVEQSGWNKVDDYEYEDEDDDSQTEDEEGAAADGHGATTFSSSPVRPSSHSSDAELNAIEVENVLSRVASVADEVARLREHIKDLEDSAVLPLRQLILRQTDGRPDVATLAMALRASRLQHVTRLPSYLKHQLAIETLQLWAPLSFQLGVAAQVPELEVHSYVLLFPRSFSGFVNWYSQLRPIARRLLSNFRRSLEVNLQQDDLLPILAKKVTLQSRFKNPASAFKKLVRGPGSRHRQELHDMLGVRVVIAMRDKRGGYGTILTTSTTNDGESDKSINAPAFLEASALPSSGVSDNFFPAQAEDEDQLQERADAELKLTRDLSFDEVVDAQVVGGPHSSDIMGSSRSGTGTGTGTGKNSPADVVEVQAWETAGGGDDVECWTSAASTTSLGLDRVQEEAALWRAYELVTSLPGWTEDQTRFKDYVSFPKPSGYQSLHVTLQHEETDLRLEVQIRSQRMHEMAEHGPASHKMYKALMLPAQVQSQSQGRGG